MHLQNCHIVQNNEHCDETISIVTHDNGYIAIATMVATMISPLEKSSSTLVKPNVGAYVARMKSCG